MAQTLLDINWQLYQTAQQATAKHASTGIEAASAYQAAIIASPMVTTTTNKYIYSSTVAQHRVRFTDRTHICCWATSCPTRPTKLITVQQVLVAMHSLETYQVDGCYFI